MDPRIASFLHARLDGPVVIGDHSWLDGTRPTVLRTKDRAGREWFVKQHVLADFYAAERDAYERWVPALGDRAPSLFAADDELLTLIVTALPGVMPERWEDPELQFQAGILLRRFHDAETLPPYVDIVARKLDALDRILPRAEELIDRGALDFARSQLVELGYVAALRCVPCHLDYSPRNWLVDDGVLYVIDFGDCRTDAWVNDFGRLFLGWHLHGEPKEAFLDGYGRVPTDDESALLRACYAARMVEQIVFAREYGLAQAEAGCRGVLAELTTPA